MENCLMEMVIVTCMEMKGSVAWSYLTNISMELACLLLA
jgi:hypothetical protein